MSKLAGKVAIVTGGATKIGVGVAEELAAAGATVIAVDINGQALAQLPGTLTGVECDVTSDAALLGLVDEVSRSHGRLDVLVNLAASYGDEGAGTRREMWLDTLNVNLVSAARAGEIARPHLARTGGCIINFTSISATSAQTGRWTYPVSKAALRHLTRLQALDYASDGIRVNSVSPGWTWSNVIEGLSEGNLEHADSVGAKFHMLGRLGRPAELGKLVAFLASDDASFITGADYACDGGYSAMGPEGREPAIPLLAPPA